MSSRADFKKFHRTVIKIGSRVICNDQGLALDRMRALAGQVDLLRRRGMEVVLVSSGAVAAGRKKLKAFAPANVKKKQALAAAGQVSLMSAWDKAFANHDVKVAQILLTADDLADRRRFMHAKNTVFTLLEMDVIPIINENDTVALDSLKFGDNDTLGSLIASLVEADLFICLTDLDGLYESDPRENPDAQLIGRVEKVNAALLAKAGREGRAPFGTGGMFAKVRAAGRLAERGVPSVIANGLTRGILPRLMDGEELGSFFKPSAKPRGARKHWLAFAARPKGKLIIDAGAAKAILEQGKSLLPKGVVSLEGLFAAGDPVVVVDARQGNEVGVGLVNYPSPEVQSIMGRPSHDIQEVLGYSHSDEVIHRDNLVIYESPAEN
ncbi:MAG: glutamate 5-kinase [Deltaproteobacteria bacterium]|jgi:glutamate 5-kinase|nr:glutamate 5-kinase [Deltaproteobacteria bacterium]